MTSAVVFEERPDKGAHTTAGIITASVATLLLLLLWLIKIITPLPPIPPDPEVLTLELFEIEGYNGGTNEAMGGGSLGNTGDPGSQNSNPNHDNAPPTNPGAITNDNSDAAYSPAHPTPGAEDASVSDETKALLEKMKNKKNNTTINVGGQGNSPYGTGGVGDGKGDGLGPNDGGIPGPGPGTGGKTARKILFKPDIANPTQEEGVVAVTVYVDRSGTVTHAEVSPTGSTTGNPVLKSTATQSAYKIRFNENPDGPESQKLTVNINFTLTK